MKRGSPDRRQPPLESDPDRFLMVLSGPTSRPIAVPTEGTLVAGSGEGADVRLEADGVEPEHLRLRATSDRVTAEVISGSVTLNDEPLDGERDLVIGDVIALGGVTLAFHDRREPPHAPLPPDRFRQRLHEEIERSLRRNEPVSLLVVALGSDVTEPAVESVCRGVRLVDVVGRIGPTEAGVVLPGTGDECAIPARRIMRALASSFPEVRIGFAVAPTDATDVHGLLAGARMAARGSRPGEVGGVRSRVRRLTLGAETVVIADPAMHRLYDLVEKLARTDLPVLISGETGTGKEMVALALHEMSSRRGRRFVAINCAAIADTLFESELFGHERGAFTDARTSKRGLLEAAEGGTVFLDEVGECSLGAQAKLLRVIETRRVGRVGSVVERPVDIRVIAASNRDLEAEVAAGRFRRDLYFRLRAASLYLPPLRDRPLDIPVLARTFLERASRDRPPTSLSDGALRRLLVHDWPGNVRELKNLMGYCAAVGPGTVIEARDLPPFVAERTAPWLLREDVKDRRPAATGTIAVPDMTPGGRGFRPLREELREIERTRIREALESTGGVRVEAARLLDLPLRTLVARISEYGITIPSSRRRWRRPGATGGGGERTEE